MNANQEELKLLQKVVREFVRDEVVPYGYRIGEQEGAIPGRFIKQLVDMGIWGMSLPVEYGGGGMGAEASAIVAAELAYGWPSLHLVWSANNSLAGYPIAKFGSAAQKLRILPRLANAEIFGCYALTEPDAGSDAASLESTATREHGAKWRLNGRKVFITNATNASVMVVFVRDSEYSGVPKDMLMPRHAGITGFIVEAKKPGFKGVAGVEIIKMGKWGLLASPFAEIVLDDVEVSSGAMLGNAGKGFAIALDTLGNGRINIAAQSVGIARRALDEAVQYAKGRVQFDRALIANQKVAYDFADLRARTEAAWQLTLRAAQAKDAGEAEAAVRSRSYTRNVTRTPPLNAS